MPQIFLQDPKSRLDYRANFATAMDDGEDLSGAPTWEIAPDGPLLEDQADTTKDSIIFVSGVVHATTYRLTCTGTTTLNRAIERTLQITGFDQ